MLIKPKFQFKEDFKSLRTPIYDEVSTSITHRNFIILELFRFNIIFPYICYNLMMDGTRLLLCLCFTWAFLFLPFVWHLHQSPSVCLFVCTFSPSLIRKGSLVCHWLELRKSIIIQNISNVFQVLEDCYLLLKCCRRSVIGKSNVF